MSLAAATFIPGLLLLVLGLPLALGLSGPIALLKAFPRSTSATFVFFGAGAVWFLINIWNLSPADFGEYRTPLFVFFGAVAILAFKYVPDFLAVRGVCALVLLGGMPFLRSAYMEYAYGQRLFMVSLVYVAVTLAIWLGAQPWRMRDFLEWLFRTPGRSRAAGWLLAGYGLLLCAVAFTY